jgi:hypothetical protein
MTEETILEHLESLLQELSILLRYEKGQFSGGFYRYKDKEEIVLNKDLSVHRKITILANELKGKVDLQQRYLAPALREVIDNAGGLGK